MTTAILRYLVKCIRKIGRHARLQENFSSFHLKYITRSKIIVLGIRFQPMPYRRSRGEKDHFQCIQTIIITSRKLKSPVIMQRTIDNVMLQSLPIPEVLKITTGWDTSTTVS